MANPLKFRREARGSWVDRSGHWRAERGLSLQYGAIMWELLFKGRPVSWHGVLSQALSRAERMTKEYPAIYAVA